MSPLLKTLKWLMKMLFDLKDTMISRFKSVCFRVQNLSILHENYGSIYFRSNTVQSLEEVAVKQMADGVIVSGGGDAHRGRLFVHPVQCSRGVVTREVRLQAVRCGGGGGLSCVREICDWAVEINEDLQKVL